MRWMQCREYLRGILKTAQEAVECNEIFDTELQVEERMNAEAKSLPARTGSETLHDSWRISRIGSAWYRMGDSVVVLLGGWLPFGLRPMGDHHQLIGEMFVHGIVGGEVMDMLKRGKGHAATSSLIWTRLCIATKRIRKFCPAAEEIRSY